MTGAMYAAVSGLKAHMSALNVIGNNVANVNTNAYKASRFTFLESLYTSVSGGANGTAQSGGKNPAQVGYGCSLGTIDLDMSTKNYSPTGQALDCMIDGDGFFLVGDKGATADQLELSRLGNFKFDNDGYLTDGQGRIVYGYPVTAADAATDGAPETNAAGEVVAQRELAPLRYPFAADGSDEDVPAGSIIYPTLAQLLAGTAPANTDGVAVLGSVGISPLSGAITGVTANDEEVILGYIAIGKVDNPNGVTHVDGHYYKAMEGAGELHFTIMDENALKAPAGGDADELTILGSGGTTLVTGGLESSGTDLASEITSMITVQRGYQANTRIVTVTDSMLEELVNMKR